MNFVSFEFVFFFLAVFVLRNALPKVGSEKWLLLAASYCFYLTWSIPYVLLLLFISVSDYRIGRKLGRTENATFRKRLLFISLALNLGALGFFKYGNFALGNVWAICNGMGFHFREFYYETALPPAISYYTFASMAYVIDVYYERTSPTSSLKDYSLFVSFFPKLLAGPIVRSRDFLPQLEQRVRANVGQIETGLCYFLLGAVKKVVISDQIAGNVNVIFAAPGQYDGLTLLLGALGYAVQIYCDFSGYSDMAIGCALLLGFRFPENFQMPYSSLSITEFWRRWHITLSTWFRDYVFLPMEVARRDAFNATLRTCDSLMVTMLLVGLWHGPSWNFVIWGGIHGAALAIHKGWTTLWPLALSGRRFVPRFAGDVMSRILTLGVILLAWVFFRAQSLADGTNYLSRMLLWKHDGIRVVSPYIVLSVLAVFLIHLLVDKDRNWAQEIPSRSIPVRIMAYTALILALSLFGVTDATPFIYFQF